MTEEVGEQWAEIGEETYEDVLKRFTGKDLNYNHYSDDESDLGDQFEVDGQSPQWAYKQLNLDGNESKQMDSSAPNIRNANNSKLLMKLTKEQKMEFKMGFNAVISLYSSSPDSKTISEDLVPDVFLAAGFTFQDSDINKMLESCVPDSNGEYAMENLLDAFDLWMSEQLMPDELGAVFNMLAFENDIKPDYPAHLAHINPRQRKKNASSSSSSSHKTRIRKDAIRNVLNNMLHRSGAKTDSVSMEDTLAFISEIATNEPEKGIHFDDFMDIFR